MKPLVWAQAAIAVTIAGALASAWAQEGSDQPQTAPVDAPTITSVTPIPVVIDPPPALPTQSVLTGFNWVRRPTGQDFARNYPHNALRNNVEGRVILDCLVGADGRLSCNVIFEDPPGHGFGEASLRISQEFRAARQTTDGRPTAGGSARVPISWRIG